MVETPHVSVIITSYTAKRLGDIFELLNSIKAQTYSNIETIFVAERSRELYDRTKAYVQENGIPNARVIFNDGELGLSAARNLGIKKAMGDIIAFVDDDVLISPDWAEEMIKTYEDDSVIAVTGPAFPLWDDESAASWFPEEFYWIMSCTAWSAWDDMKEVRNAWGMNMSFRREAFEKAGLFTSDFGLCNSKRTGWVDPPSEDVDMSLRARAKTGKHIFYNPNAKVRHRVYNYRISQSFIKQRAYSVGYQRRILKKLYPENGKDSDLLSQEHQLLRRILTRLFPDIARQFFTNPVIAWRKLQVSVTVLFSVALGYYSYLLPKPLRRSHNLDHSYSAPERDYKPAKGGIYYQ